MVALADWLIEAKLSKTRKLDYAMNADPMSRTKDEYAAIVDHISVANSPVGIDAQLTHAIIITYLQQIAARLDKIESQLSAER